MKQRIFDSQKGRRIYDEAVRAIREHGMQKLLEGGVILGLSGGADSVLLLHFLIEYREKSNAEFKILPVHVNHGIRGEEALADELFSKKAAEALGLEFIALHVDVPAYAENNALGIEEAARKLRYDGFNELIRVRSDVSCIAVAHNSDDNFETLLFNLVRGAGTHGLSGIAPVRDNIVRPLIYVSKVEIQALLQEKKIEYVTDSTNFSIDYTRNYIRHEIVPRLKRINSEPQASINRMCSALRADDSYINSVAEKFISENYINGTFDNSALAALHAAVFARVIMLSAKEKGITRLEFVHIEKVRALLRVKENFRVSLPERFEFISELGRSRIARTAKCNIGCVPLKMGENHFPAFNSVIILSDHALDEFSLNVYKISIQAAVPFDIINNGLFVRSKNDGDSYFYGGITHKLKKLFNDRKIPPSLRGSVPVFCDERGIVWVPGFGIRADSAQDKRLYIAITEYGEPSDERRFYIPSAKKAAKP